MRHFLTNWTRFHQIAIDFSLWFVISFVNSITQFYDPFVKSRSILVELDWDRAVYNSEFWAAFQRVKTYCRHTLLFFDCDIVNMRNEIFTKKQSKLSLERKFRFVRNSGSIRFSSLSFLLFLSFVIWSDVHIHNHSTEMQRFHKDWKKNWNRKVIGYRKPIHWWGEGSTRLQEDVVVLSFSSISGKEVQTNSRARTCNRFLNATPERVAKVIFVFSCARSFRTFDWMRLDA
jgi:hypothetical protein